MKEKKFSKSRSVGIFGDDVQHLGIPADAWRFYLSRIRPEYSDSDFTWDDFIIKVNNELINTYANFIHRVTSLCEDNFNSQVPYVQNYTETEKKYIKFADEVIKEYNDMLLQMKLKDGTNLILKFAQLGNQYLNETAPWTLIKNKEIELSKQSIAFCCNWIKCLCALTYPYMPNTAKEIANQFSLSEVPFIPDKFILDLPPKQKILPSKILFTRIASSKAEELRLKFSGTKVAPILFTKNKEITWPCVILEIQDIKVARKLSELEDWKSNLLNNISVQHIANLPHVKAYSDMIGNIDKSNIPNSVINLINLASSENRLPNINTLVDIYNCISLKRGIVSGAYDRICIMGNIDYTIADGTEIFIPVKVNEQEKIYTGEWILKDSKNNVITKLFTKQSASSAITLNTQNCIMCFQGNPLTTIDYVKESAIETAEKIVSVCGGYYNILYCD